jgi:hypothetical protein
MAGTANDASSGAKGGDADTPIYTNMSLFIMKPAHPLRAFAIKITSHKKFDQIILTLILLNCVFLCLNDPMDTDEDSSRNVILNLAGMIFGSFFFVEMILKVIAMGFYTPFTPGKQSYLEDTWNDLDFTLVALWVVGFFLSVNLSALRTFRVLRPLRTLSSNPGMRVITKAMIASIPDLFNVLMLCAFVFFIFGIIGVQLYNGTLDGRCFIAHEGQRSVTVWNSTEGTTFWKAIGDPDTPWDSKELTTPSSHENVLGYAPQIPDDHDEDNCAMWHQLDWPVNIRDAIMVKQGQGRRCDPITVDGVELQRYCGREMSFSYGTGSFDNIGKACLSIMTSITLEGWVDIMYMLMNGFGIPVFTAIYFIMMILLGSMFMLNLALAVIENSMGDAQEEEDEASEEVEDQFDPWGDAEDKIIIAKHRSLGWEDPANTEKNWKKIADSLPRLIEKNKETFPKYNVSLPADKLDGLVFALRTEGTGVIVKETSSCLPQVKSKIKVGHVLLKVNGSQPMSVEEVTAAFAKSVANESNVKMILQEPSRIVYELVPSNDRRYAGAIVRPKRNSEDAQERWDTALMPHSCPNCPSSMRTPVDNAEDKCWPYSRGLKFPDEYGGISPYMWHLVHHKVFEGTIIVFILANTMVLAMVYHNAPTTYVDGLNSSNYVFTTVFTCEMICLLMGLGPRAYVKDPMCLFDGLIVISSLVELVFELSGQKSAGGLSALRSFRLFRMFKLAKSWKALNDLLATLIASIKGVANAAVLLGIMVFIFTLVGMQLFGGKMSDPGHYCDTEALITATPHDPSQPSRVGEVEACDDVPRHNFDTLWWSFVTVFQVLTGENWNEVLYNGITATTTQEDLEVSTRFYTLGCIYFIVLTIIGNYVIFNIFMAILLAEFDDDSDEEPPMPPSRQALAVTAAKVVPEESVAASPAPPPGSGTAKVVPEDDSSEPANMLEELPEPQSQDDDAPQLYGNAFFIVSTNNPIRKLAFATIIHPIFDNFILALIAISSVLLAIDQPHLEYEGVAGSDKDLKDGINVLNYIITICFIGEMVLKITALGFMSWGHPHAYMRNRWNNLDFFIVVISVVGLVTEATGGSGGQMKSLRSLRALRALRPLRVISRYPGMRCVVNSIFMAMPKIINVAVVSMLFYLILGIVGVQNWAGGLNQCNNPEKSCKYGVEITPLHPALCCGPTCGYDAGGDHDMGMYHQALYEGTTDDCEKKEYEQISFPFGLACTADIACGYHPENEVSIFPDKKAFFYAACPSDGDCTCGLLPGDDEQDDCMARAYCQHKEHFMTPFNPFNTTTNTTTETEGADGTTHFCNIPESERWDGFTNSDGKPTGVRGGADLAHFKITEEWGTQNQPHFDDVGNALLTVFEVSSGEMWPDIMYTIVDIVGGGAAEPDQPMFNFVARQNKPPGSRSFGYERALYFIVIQIMCAFLLLNLFVGVVVDSFNDQKAGGDGGPLITQEQERWIKTQRLALSSGPERKVNPPKDMWRREMFVVVESRAFELVIMAAIMLNVVTMAMRKFDQSDAYTSMLEICNLVFVGIFTVEMVLKVYALGPSEYFTRNWNRFDFTIVVLSYLQMDFTKIEMGEFATLLRVARVARIFRLVQTNKNLCDLFKTLLFSLPSIVNVASVTILLLFIYAVAGMNVFSEVKLGDNLSNYANFKNFFNSMLLLFRMATGESYNGVMHDCMVKPPMCCSEDMMAEGLCGKVNCGEPVGAPIFFLSFFIMSALLMLNLLVAIILDNYSEQENEEENMVEVKPEHMEKFKHVWAEKDPTATGFIPLTDLPWLIMHLPLPLGLNVPDEHGNPSEVDEWEMRQPARARMRKMQIPEYNGKVSFQETLSTLVDTVYEDDVGGGLVGSAQLKELENKKSNIKSLKTANRQVKKAGKLKEDGQPFTVEESTASLMMQSMWRGHEGRRKQGPKSPSKVDPAAGDGGVEDLDSKKETQQ